MLGGKTGSALVSVVWREIWRSQSAVVHTISGTSVGAVSLGISQKWKGTSSWVSHRWEDSVEECLEDRRVEDGGNSCCCLFLLNSCPRILQLLRIWLFISSTITIRRAEFMMRMFCGGHCLCLLSKFYTTRSLREDVTNWCCLGNGNFGRSAKSLLTWKIRVCRRWE